jgi:hypothetical protein
MRNTLKMTIGCIMICVTTLSLGKSLNNAHQSEKNYFQFSIMQYHTSRQSGQTVNIYVRYAYKKNLPTNAYPDYRILRTTILKYMEPSDALPANIFWELIATQMGKVLMKKFPLDGVSIQLHVLDNPDAPINEPGDHGPIYTIGQIAPLDVH